MANPSILDAAPASSVRRGQRDGSSANVGLSLPDRAWSPASFGIRHRPFKRVLPALCAGLLVAGMVSAQKPKKPEVVPPGKVQELVFTERHKLSAIEEQCKRLAWTLDSVKATDPERAGRYEIKDEKFVAYVPKSSTPKTPSALFVWVHPTDDPWVDPEWISILERRNVIMIEALRSGNERHVWYRMGLALDAVHNMRAQHAVDPARIWIGGFSGGGRVASAMGFFYPDVFTGVYAMGGCNYFDTVRADDSAKTEWKATIPRPMESLFLASKTKLRHVWFVGEQDFNHGHTKAAFEHMKRTHGFAHVLLQEPPGFAHVPAPATHFDLGLKFLGAK